MPSTRTGYLAVKKEATAGTGVVPTNFVHYKGGDLGANLEVIKNNPIQAVRHGAITAHAGKKSTDGSFEMDLDWKECGYFLGAGLSFDSSPTNNGDSTYTHTMDEADTLAALSIEQAKGDLSSQAFECNRAFGAYVDNFEIGASDGLCTLKVNIKSLGIFQRSRMVADAAAGSSVAISVEDVEGLVATTDTVRITDDSSNEEDAIASISTANKTVTIATLGNSYTVAANGKIELVPQTPSFVAQVLMSFDMVKFQFGANLTAAGSASEENVEDWTFTWANNLEERYGSLRRTPSVIAPKASMGQLKFKRYFESRADRDAYLNTERKACIITIQDVNTIIGSGTQNPILAIKISDLRYTAYELPTGADDLYVAEIEGECFYDSSDARAVRLELTTTVADFTA